MKKIIIILFLVKFTLFAETTVPNSFTSGGIISASEMNANFDALVTAINNLQSSVSTLESDLNTAESTILTLESDLDTAESNIISQGNTIITLESDLDTAESTITTLQTDINNLSNNVILIAGADSGTHTGDTISHGDIETIVFSKEIVDTANAYSPVTGAFTVPEDGNYLINATVYGTLSRDSTVAGGYTSLSLILYKNEEQVVFSRPIPIDNNVTVSLPVVGMINCVEGDVIQVKLQFTGYIWSADGGSNARHMSIVKVD